jgi:hypothetical protein
MTNRNRLLSKEQARKLAEFCNQRIAHDKFQDAMAVISNFHNVGCFADSPGILTLVGETGAGKSSVISDYCRSQNVQGDYKKVVSVFVPEDCTIKSLASRLLLAIGDPSGARGTREDMERRIRVYVQNTGVELLIFDEFQHISAGGSLRRQYDAADWIKTQVEVLKKPIMFVGLPQVHDIFAVNAQLQTRRKGKIELPPFDLNSKEDGKSLVLFFHMLNHYLPLPDREASVLRNPSAVQFLAQSAKGLIGYMTAYVHKATEFAMLEGAETLTSGHLYEAVEEIGLVKFDVGVGAIRPTENVRSGRKGILRKGVRNVL